MANFLLNNRFISMDLAKCNRRNRFIGTIGFGFAVVTVVLYQRAPAVKRSLDQILETVRIWIYRIFKKKIPTDKQLEEFSYDGIELPEHPMGIPNLKNKCFMNSFLQVMVWTPRFAKQLFKQLELDNSKKAEMSRSILKLLYVHYKFQEEHVVDESIPKCIVKAVRKINSQFEGDNQEDSFEIFNTILNGIEDEGLTILNVSTDCEYKEKESSINDLPVSTLFRGKLVSKWSFFSCPHEEDITQVFTSLSVPVGHVLKQEDDKELKSNTEQRGHGTEENREDVEENDTGHVPSKNSSEEENCEAESDEKEDNVYKNELINDTAQIKKTKTTTDEQESESQSENKPNENYGPQAVSRQDGSEAEKDNNEADKELKSNTEQREYGTEENREDVEENETRPVPNKNSSEEENCEAESDEKEDNVYKNELINDTAQLKKTKTTTDEQESESPTENEPNESYGRQVVSRQDGFEAEKDNNEDDIELKSNTEQREYGTEENREDVEENETGHVPYENSSEEGDKELKSNTEQRGYGTEENREDVEENETGHVPNKNSSEEENCEAESDEKEDIVYKNELINDTAQIKEDDKELKSNAEHREHGTEENREDVEENDTGHVPNKNRSESGVVSTRDITDVEKGLSELMKQEEFDEELIGCRKCTNREPDGKSRKTLKVSHPPPVLVLQINRFEIDYSGQLSKVQQTLTYPSILNLSPFCDDAPNGGKPVKYSLYGVVNHIGDIHGGHYSAHIKTKNRNTKFLEELVEGKRSEDCVVHIDNDPDPGWYYVSDTFVSKSTEDRALSLEGAYILMYERIKTEINK